MLRTLVDEVAHAPELYRPLPTPNKAWDLLAQAEEATPQAVDLLLAHPYTGAWLAYTRRLANNIFADNNYPLCVHIGHFHALAASAAIHAKIRFETQIPVRGGEAFLPTLGTARLLPADNSPPWSVATVWSDGKTVRVGTAATEVALPADPSQDGTDWWGMRRLVTQEVNQRHLDVRLDDLDPYRGLHEPALADRTDQAEADEWQALLNDAWQLIATCVPSLADGFPIGFDSLVPRPEVPFKYMSGSTSETFGSAVVAKPPNAELLAAALVHEFQHSRLHALMHITCLHEPDPSERYYTLWRDDPRPMGGVLHGVYAFFGMTAFWRRLAKTRPDRRASFEHDYCRTGTWRTLQELRRDPKLTPVGQRFVNGIAKRLTRWHQETIAPDISILVQAAATDHYAGWRLRHIRPSSDVVATLTNAWVAGDFKLDTIVLPADAAPTPEPDGTWTGARTELIRITLSDPDGTELAKLWPSVPGATRADFDYAARDLTAATRGYLEELRDDPDRVSSWIGLGLTLSAQDASNPTARAILTYPELVRAVHREIRSRSTSVPAPDELAGWITSVIAFPVRYANSAIVLKTVLRSTKEVELMRALRLDDETVLTVKAARGNRNGRPRRGVSTESIIIDIIKNAMQNVQNATAPQEEWFHRTDGGVTVLVPDDVPRNLLVQDLPNLVAKSLAAYNESHRHDQIRLRMAIDAKPADQDDAEYTSRLACRLVDSRALTRQLNHTVDLALTVSDSFFNEVIRDDPACEPRMFREARMHAKGTRAIARIRRF